MKTFFFIWSSPNFGPKTGLNLTEDFFFFWSSPKFGQENGLGFGLENFHSGSLFSNFLNFLPPPFRKSCVCYCLLSLYYIIIPLTAEKSPLAFHPLSFPRTNNSFHHYKTGCKPRSSCLVFDRIKYKFLRRKPNEPC